MTEEKDKVQENQQSKEFLAESGEYITEGARVFSERASEIFNNFMGKVRETAESAYEKGSEIYENVSLSAQSYLERYRNRNEMANLKEQRDEVAAKLGYMCFMEYSGRYRFRVEFMKSDEFKELMSQIRELDNRIIKIGKELDEQAR